MLSSSRRPLTISQSLPMVSSLPIFLISFSSDSSSHHPFHAFFAILVPDSICWFISFFFRSCSWSPSVFLLAPQDKHPWHLKGAPCKSRKCKFGVKGRWTRGVQTGGVSDLDSFIPTCSSLSFLGLRSISRTYHEHS